MTDHPRKIMTLVMIHQPPRLLLGMKKRGFGAGRWNGFGGKLEPDETLEQAARREVREEVGLEIGPLEERGVLVFEFQGNPEMLEVRVFHADRFSGEPTESEEMKPQWFKEDEIPFDEMWPDDPYWIPLFLTGQHFSGHILFGEGDKILSHTIAPLV